MFPQKVVVKELAFQGTVYCGYHEEFLRCGKFFECCLSGKIIHEITS